jgi:thiopurine S-methyltransferase
LPDFGGRLQCDDFFSFAPGAPFELIYERAFLCALPRHRWPDYAPRMAELLAPGGLLTGYFFIDEAALKGPPFGISASALAALLAPWFDLIDDQPTPDGIGPFAGKERWMVWRRR